ncbi:MAG: ChuX/HutX family heme-like substrate-binding protein [Burkholderiaceae bacterium]
MATPGMIDPRDHGALRDAWREMAARRMRQRDIAAALDISEARLLGCRVGIASAARGEPGQAPASAPGQPTVIRLRSDLDAIRALIEGLPALGPVMALTRNDSCVHEKDGPYRDIELAGHAGLALGVIDLRLFYRRWRHAFAVEDTSVDPPQRSLQCYLSDGDATHKVFLRPASDVPAWRALVERLRAPEQAPGLEAETPLAIDYPLADEVDAQAFARDWLAMRDTHEFFPLLKRYGLARTRALRLAPDGHAMRVGDDTVERALTAAAASGLSIMVFVGNPGCVQIHTGPVVRIERMGPWLNVLDPGFNLHLRGDHVRETWVVRKPTSDGIVTSIELYDEAGRLIATLFGERKPGRPESPDWRALVSSLTEAA